MKSLERRLRLLESKIDNKITEPPPIIFFVVRDNPQWAFAIIPGIPGQTNGLTVTREANETEVDFHTRIEAEQRKLYELKETN